MTCYYISYSNADLDWAEWLAWQLEDKGHRTITQDWDFAPGLDFALKMEEAAAAADKIIAVISPDYLKALYMQPEWTTALVKHATGTESKLIPILVKECAPEDLLRQIAYVNIVGLDEESASREFLNKAGAEIRGNGSWPEGEDEFS